MQIAAVGSHVGFPGGCHTGTIQVGAIQVGAIQGPYRWVPYRDLAAKRVHINVLGADVTGSSPEDLLHGGAGASLGQLGPAYRGCRGATW